MSTKHWILGAVTASILTLSGCREPENTGPGGGPSSGAVGSTSAPGDDKTTSGSTGGARPGAL